MSASDSCSLSDAHAQLRTTTADRIDPFQLICAITARRRDVKKNKQSTHVSITLMPATRSQTADAAVAREVERTASANEHLFRLTDDRLGTVVAVQHA